MEKKKERLFIKTGEMRWRIPVELLYIYNDMMGRAVHDGIFMMALRCYTGITPSISWRFGVFLWIFMRNT